MFLFHQNETEESVQRGAYLIFELGDLPLAGGVTLQVFQHYLRISQEDFCSLQVFLQPLLGLHIPLAHLNDKQTVLACICYKLSGFLLALLVPRHRSKPQSGCLSHQKEVAHTKSCTLISADRHQRRSDGGTWSWALSSLDSSSRLSRNTFCLSSYSSSSCTSICFSCRTW